MLVQKSYKDDRKTIYFIPTPIGNLEDITVRAINTLRKVDVIFCEDTRVTVKLLNNFNIKKTLYNLHEHNVEQAIEKISNLLQEGNSIGIVSDAGMPGISDPGFEVISFANENNINIVILPGATAFILPIIRSNFPNNKFQFAGFLNKKDSKKRKQITEIIEKNVTTAFYESTHKLLSTLELISEIDKNAQITVGRELTKIYEEYVTGNITEVYDYYLNNSVKGENVIVISSKELVITQSLSIEQQVSNLIEQGVLKKDAIKQVAKENKISKNEVYKLYFNQEEQ